MIAAKTPLWLYDTTLRDGAQREGISLSLTDKLTIAHSLDRLGIPFIEGGWPGANPKDGQFFLQLRENPLQQSEIVAFCSTRRPNQAVETDKMLKAIIAAETRWVTIFGKSWDLHVTAGLQTTLVENLAMIKDTIAYLRSQGRRVIYDAEHWFDGYTANPDYALATLDIAREAGAEWLVLCDTNGGTLPGRVGEVTANVKRTLGLDNPLGVHPRLGIHAHNDSGTAVANSLMAVEAGARMVQGTINGYGERCGNADLCTLIPNLKLKLDYDCLKTEKLVHLTSTSSLVSEIVNLAPDDHAPFVGRSAFAHKGGIHVSAVQRNPFTYEHIAPETIGNERRIVVSEQAGLSNVLSKAESFGIALDRDNPACRIILYKLKNLEKEGYQFEAAEASFELLMREAMGDRQPLFEVRGFQVHCDLLIPADNPAYRSALATVKVSVNGQDILEVAEGNGPVSALDGALRKALTRFYPQITDFYLTDYKVRILDGGAGTSAKTRVLVESSNDGTVVPLRHRRWTTVGVSANILEASYQAVVEGIEYGLRLLTCGVKGAQISDRT